MADLESSLRTLTLQHPSVASAFGNRLYWSHIPDGISYPCIKAQTIVDPPMRTHRGTFGGRALVQFDVYDDDKTSCNAGAELIKGWLDNYNGGMGSYNVTIQVRNIPSDWDAEARLFRKSIEIEILYIG